MSSTILQGAVTRLWHALTTIGERLADAAPQYVIAVLALYVVSLFIVGARWRGFMRALGGRVGVGRATLATLAGIAVGNLTPSSRLAGEACRVTLVRAAGTVTWGQAAIAAVWDRISELPSILVLAAMATVAARDMPSAWRTGAIVAAIVVLLVAGGLAMRSLRRAGASPGGWRQRLALDRITGRVFAVGAGYSALMWLQDFLRLGAAALAFGVVLPPTKIAALSILAMLGGLVPTVGGLGAVEGGLMAGLVAFGVDVPTAAAITAVERAVSYVFSTVAGAIVVLLLGGRSLWTALRAARAPEP
jgi:uncharacterized membrane protein YbhN (UPF0104 family)